MFNQAVVKGTGIAYFRDFLMEAEAYQVFLDQLTDDEQAQFKKVMPVSWIPITLASRFYETCADVLYAGQAQNVEILASRVAEKDLKGIYRVLVKVISIKTMVRQAAKLWKVNHQKGTAHSWEAREQLVILEVDDYPEMSECYGRVTNGYLAGMVAMTGVRNIRVKTERPQPAKWRWSISWG